MRSTTKRMLAATLASLLVGGVGAQTVLDSPELYPGEKALYEAAKKEGMVVSFDTGPTWANWAAQFTRLQEALPRRRDRLQRPRLGRHRGRAGQGAQPPAGRHRLLLRGVGGRRCQARAWSRRSSRSTSTSCPAVFRDPDGRWFTIHSLTVAFIVNTKLVKNVPQSLGRSAQARVQELGRVPRSALDRRRARCMTFAANFARRRRHEQRPARARLSRQAAQVGQRAARARHHAVRAVRQGRDPDLDLVRERRSEGEVHRRSRRRGRGRDPEGGVGRCTLRHQPGRKRARTRTPASCG